MKKLRILLGITISVVLLYYSFRGIDWNNFRDSFLQVPILVIVSIIALNFVAAIIRGWRWRILLSNLGDVSLMDCFNYTNIGYFVNSVLPARVGDLVRPLLLARKIERSKVSVLTTVIVERLFDIITLLSFLIYAVIVMELPSWMKRNGSLVIAVSFILLLFLFVFSKKETFFERVVDVLSFNIQRIKNFLKPKIRNFLLAARILTDIRRIVLVWFLSTCIVVIYVTSAYLVLHSLQLGISEWNASIAAMIFVSLAMIIPASPGNFGTYQLACILSLGLFGVLKTDALAISFLLQIPVYLLSVGLGFFSIWWEGLKFESIRSSTRTAHIPDAGPDRFEAEERTTR